MNTEGHITTEMWKHISRLPQSPISYETHNGQERSVVEFNGIAVTLTDYELRLELMHGNVPAVRWVMRLGDYERYASKALHVSEVTGKAEVELE